MRIVPDSMTAGWYATEKIGDARCTVRATIQRQNMRRFEYDTTYVQGIDPDQRHRAGHFASFIFGDNSPYLEIKNIKSYEWDRSIGQDAATCTITLLNTELTSIGSPRDNPSSPDEFDKPGYFTFNRGEQTIGENRWGYDTETGWNAVFMPDMVVKTYEGYGVDRTVSPPLDANLVQSGTWMIDKVTYSTDGTITLEMRDLARLLLDSIVFPPAIPMYEYPLTWSANQTTNVPHRDVAGGSFVDNLKRFGSASSSNDSYIGTSFTNAPYPHYVGALGAVDGHHASEVIMSHPAAGSDDTDDLFWISTGQDNRDDFVWWQFDADSRMPVGALRLAMHGGPYRLYISIHDGTRWLGQQKIHWKRDPDTTTPSNTDIGGNIPFVKSSVADRWHHFDVILPRVYNAKKIRLTLTRLADTGVGEHPFRGGIRELKLYTAGSVGDISFVDGLVEEVLGNYGDFTHIIKWVCAWAGWYWPPHNTGLDFLRIQQGYEEGPDKDWITFEQPDPVLPKGRVWGDFMRSGTAGIADLTIDMFDKKPLMDIINYVRDLLGFIFFIDEAGGVVWRMPNLGLGGTPKLGNYLSPEDILDGSTPTHKPGHRGRYGRTSEIITIDEEDTLFGYQVLTDSASLRDRIFVANAVSGVGVVIKGFNPNPVGLKRTAGWSDQHFKTKREAKVMADMISAQQMFSYRVGNVTIPGYPAIQVDDQIRIFERVTDETFYHYVQGIKCSLDMESGEWTYDLTTHWLGEHPSDAWAVRVEELSNVTQQYLAALGWTPTDSEDNDVTGVGIGGGGGGGGGGPVAVTGAASLSLRGSLSVPVDDWRTDPLLLPASDKVTWGMFTSTGTSLSTLETSWGAPINLTRVYSGGGPILSGLDACQTHLNAGRVPVASFNWKNELKTYVNAHPTNIGGTGKTLHRFMADGLFDGDPTTGLVNISGGPSNIPGFRAVARKVKAFTAGACPTNKVVLTPWHEFENTAESGFGITKDPTGFTNFRQAWHRMRTVFDNEAVTNVLWGFCGATGVGDWGESMTDNSSDGFYPGHAYVDWAMWDPYNSSGLINASGVEVAGRSGNAWLDFGVTGDRGDGGTNSVVNHWGQMDWWYRNFKVGGKATAAAVTGSEGVYKPVILGETGTGDYDSHNDPTNPMKRASVWFDHMATWLTANHDVIRGAIYFNNSFNNVEVITYRPVGFPGRGTNSIWSTIT